MPGGITIRVRVRRPWYLAPLRWAVVPLVHLGAVKLATRLYLRGSVVELVE